MQQIVPCRRETDGDRLGLRNGLRLRDGVGFQVRGRGIGSLLPLGGAVGVRHLRMSLRRGAGRQTQAQGQKRAQKRKVFLHFHPSIL